MNEEVAIVLVVVIAGPLMWTAVCHLLATMGGWKRIAEDYPAVRLPQGQCYRMEGGLVGMVSYKGCLTIYTTVS